MSDENKKKEKQKIDWDELPNGLVGWFLWCFPKSCWRWIIILGSIFFLHTFYQLSTIRSTQVEQMRSEILNKTNLLIELWNRSNDTQWRIGLLNNWNPEEIPLKIWDKATMSGSLEVRRAVALHTYAPLFNLKKLMEDKDEIVGLPAILNLSENKEQFNNHILNLDISSFSIEVKNVLLNNLNENKEFLEKMSKDKSKLIREKADKLLKSKDEDDLLSLALYMFSAGRDKDLSFTDSNNFFDLLELTGNKEARVRADALDKILNLSEEEWKNTKNKKKNITEKPIAEVIEEAVKKALEKHERNKKFEKDENQTD